KPDYAVLRDPEAVPAASATAKSADNLVAVSGSSANMVQSAMPVGDKQERPKATHVPAEKPDVEAKEPHGRIVIRPVDVRPPAAQHAEAQEPPDAPILGAMRCYIDKRPVQAIEHLRKYDKLSQELLICLLPLAVELAEVEKINPKQMEMTVEQLQMLLD